MCAGCSDSTNYAPRMQSACGTNLAPECLRIDGIARFSLPPSAPFFLPDVCASRPDAFVHVCTPEVLKDTRADTKYSMPAANARVLTSHEEESRFFPSSLIFCARSVSVSPPLPAGFFRSPSSPTSLFFLSYCALFQSLVVAVYYARAGTHAILFEPFA